MRMAAGQPVHYYGAVPPMRKAASLEAAFDCCGTVSF
jgi:hypothetical protein